MSAAIRFLDPQRLVKIDTSRWINREQRDGRAIDALNARRGASLGGI